MHQWDGASVLGRGRRGGAEPWGWGAFKPGAEKGFRIDLLRKVEEGMGEMGRRCGQSSEAGLLGRQPIRSLGCV